MKRFMVASVFAQYHITDKVTILWKLLLFSNKFHYKYLSRCFPRRSNRNVMAIEYPPSLPNAKSTK